MIRDSFNNKTKFTGNSIDLPNGNFAEYEVIEGVSKGYKIAVDLKTHQEELKKYA